MADTRLYKSKFEVYRYTLKNVDRVLEVKAPDNEFAKALLLQKYGSELLRVDHWSRQTETYTLVYPIKKKCVFRVKGKTKIPA